MQEDSDMMQLANTENPETYFTLKSMREFDFQSELKKDEQTWNNNSSKLDAFDPTYEFTRKVAAPAKVSEESDDQEYTLDISDHQMVQHYLQCKTKLDEIIPRIGAIPDELLDKLMVKFHPTVLLPTPFLKDLNVDQVIIREPKYLAHKNAHPWDSRIVFVEESKDHQVNIHKYFVDGSCLDWMSVTGLISAFFSEFDSKSQAISTFSSKAFAQCNHRPSYKYHGCKTPEDIMAKWNGTSSLGTKLHANIESYWNNEPFHVISENKESFRQFIELFQDKKWVTWEPFRTEFAIFDPETKVSGQIDFLGMLNPELGHVVIIDWKRCESITDFSFSRIQGKAPTMGKGCCCQMEDTKFLKYSLQLNTYKYLIEKNYPWFVKNMYIVQCHDCLKKYGAAVYKMPNMQKQVLEIMATRKIALDIQTRRR